MINRKQEERYERFLVDQGCSWPGCGRPVGWIHEEKPVGMGRNKKKLSKIGISIGLCVEHHIYRHSSKFCPKSNERDGEIKRELERLAKEEYPERFASSIGGLVLPTHYSASPSPERSLK